MAREPDSETVLSLDCICSGEEPLLSEHAVKGESEGGIVDTLPRAAAGSSLMLDALVVLSVAWLVRALFILIVPAAAHSFDVDHWQHVARILEQGGNPYMRTTYLNWPPVWMQLIEFLSRASGLLGVSFLRVLQTFLLAVEAAVALVVLRMARELVPTADVRRILIVGISLNPVAILLICQHCNFDILAALWILLFMGSLLAYNRGNNPVDFLSACLFLGLSILTKTFPLILAPLLAHGFRQFTPKIRFLGSLLLLGPVVLGMSIIYVLAPEGVTTNVLAYRSYSGWFGVTGLLLMGGADELLSIYGTFFSVLVIAVMVFVAFLIWRRPRTEDREFLLLAALLLTAVPALGPGYAPQYFYWFLPLLILTFAVYPGRWRGVLVGFYLIAAVTYLVEYAIFPSHGAFLTRLTGSEPFITWSRTWSTQGIATLIRLPIFFAFLTLLAEGFTLLRRSLKENAIESIKLNT